MKRKIRVAFFENPREEFGGGPKMVSEIVSRLSEKYHVELFATKYLKDLSKLSSLKFDGIKMNLMKPSSKYLSPLSYLLNKKKDFDVSICLTSLPSSFAVFRNNPSITICCAPNRMFYELRGYMFKKAGFKGKAILILKNILLKKLDYLAAQKTDKMLSVSNSVRAEVKKYYNRDSELFYPGIDFKQYHSGEYGDYVLSVARLVHHKRVDEIVKAMGFVKNKDIKLKVVGGGQDTEKIKKLCEKYPNVEFLGFVDDEELINLYANCRALVYVPIKEPEGYAPLEAGASEKTTIGVNDGGLKETIIHGRTGFLINNLTPKKIADKIDLLANDPNLAKMMGREAYKYTKKFDWKNTIKVLENAIEEVAVIPKVNLK